MTPAWGEAGATRGRMDTGFARGGNEGRAVRRPRGLSY